MSNQLLQAEELTFPSEVPNPQAAEEHLQNENRILIVEDEESLRGLFAESLRDRYQCVTASNAQEALDLLAKEEFALVISDVQMPGLSGIELLRKIVSSFPDVAVVIVSGVDRSQRVIDALRLGAFDYLIKPCDLDVLQLSVEGALERRALLRNGKLYRQELERRNAELAAQKAELVRLQAQLVHSEKMASIGQLAAGVAHELNNPAGFIYSNMESLGHCTSQLSRVLSAYDRVPLSSEFASEIEAIKAEVSFDGLLSEFRSIVEDCQEGARRIRDIVFNLRTFSRLDEAELKRVDIHGGIDATIRLLSQYYNSNHLTLIREYSELPLVECFAGQLNQVWMNLLTNAAQAVGQQPGEIRIETAVGDDSVIVRISDTGQGITPEHLDRIFDPFFSTKAVGEGTGLGLSISYGIVASHGGFISVESDVGKGTTFTVVIPLCAKRPETPEGK
jgi:signal transduction histidine kinase